MCRIAPYAAKPHFPLVPGGRNSQNEEGRNDRTATSDV